MKITVETKGLDVLIAKLANQQKQVAFAAAKALTQTAKAVQKQIPAFLDKGLDRPTPFTKSGTYLQAARKDKLEAVVGFKDRQASYLKWQVEGGVRSPSKKALRLPSAVQLNQYGNLPNGIIRQLIAVARKESGLAKRTSRRIKVSHQLELFYGDPKDVGNHKFPPGIYKIVKTASGSQLVPLIVFPQTTAKYKPRLNLEQFARPIVAREFDPAFRVALRQALATAR